MLPRPLAQPLLHGTYIEDILFGVIFLVMLGVFVYYYFSDKGEAELEDNEDAEAKVSEKRDK